MGWLFFFSLVGIIGFTLGRMYINGWFDQLLKGEK